MIDLVQSWTTLTSSDKEIARRQHLLNIILLALAVPGFIFSVITLFRWLLGSTPTTEDIAGLSILPLSLLSYWLSHKGQVRFAAYITTSVVFIAMTASFFQIGIGHVSIVGMVMVIVTAGVIISSRAALAYSALSVIAYSVAGWYQNAGNIQTVLLPSETVIVDAIGLSLGLGVLVIFNWMANRDIHHAVQVEQLFSSGLLLQSKKLEDQIAKRTLSLQQRSLELQAISEIAGLAAQRLTSQNLMSQAVEIIRDRFNFYHVSIFLLDESETWAELAASTGEAGHKLITSHYRLAVGSASIVGWTTANRLLRVSQDITNDPFYYSNPLLPDTRSEIAIPLAVGQRLIGALDIQSNEPQIFVEDYISPLEAIANEIAIAIDNARLLSETQARLERIERDFRGQTQDSWARFLRKRKTSEYRLSRQQGPISDEMRQGMEQAAESGRTFVSSESKELVVPVQIRGQVIATIGAQKGEDEEPWSDDDIALIEAVANQTALSFETSRQYTEEQRRVAELEVINRVSQAVSQMLRLKVLYRVIHTQLNRVLGEVDMYIALYDPNTDQISLPYISEQHQLLKMESISFGQDLTSQVIRTRQSLLLMNEAECEAAAPGEKQIGRRSKSWLGVPMLVGNDVIGMITVQDPLHEHRFTEEDAALLLTIASQIATAIQNSRLMEQIQNVARREHLIREITAKVRRTPDIHSTLEVSAQELGRALNVSSASIRLGVQSEPSDAQDTDNE